MRVPFFRSKAKTDSVADIPGGLAKHSLRGKKGGLAMVGGLDGIASESELSSYAPATPMSSAGNVARTAVLGKALGAGGAATQTARLIADQMGEMEAFLATIDGFQGEARRLFPENMALDQILGELRDECRRRVDYMTRVSAPPAWMAHQRQSSSSSTIIAGNTRRVAGPPGTAQVRARSATDGYGGIDSSPISTATATSTSGSSDSSYGTGRRQQHGGSFAENKNNEGYFSRHQASNTARKAPGSPPSSPPQSPSLAPAQTVGRRDVSDIATTRGSAGANRSATSHGATLPKLPRASMALAGLDSPRFAKARTSSTDNFGRPLSFADAGDMNSNSSPAQLGTKGSFGVMRGVPTVAKAKQQQQQQQMAATPHSSKIAGDYVFNIKLGGLKVEAAVSLSLQTSLVSLHLAKLLGLPVIAVPTNSRVWSSGGKSWPVVGEVVGLPFVCGNMTFTHSFKVVQGSAGMNDMSRDIMVGNDFCVCNHGRIKDNQLHLEQLSMPITVPVRQIPAN